MEKKLIGNIDYLPNKLYFDNRYYIYEWLPTTPIKAIVQVVHGAKEHIERYSEFAGYLNDHGIAVIGHNIQGHGPDRDYEPAVFFAHKNGYEEVCQRVVETTDYIKHHYPNIEITLLGHSMGSFIARYVIAKNLTSYDKVIISGTTKENPLMIELGSMLASIYCMLFNEYKVSRLLEKLSFESLIKKAHVEHFEDWVTKDRQKALAFRNDPYCHQPFTISAMKDLMTWIRFINKTDNLEDMNRDLEIMIIGGQLDSLSNNGKGLIAFKKMLDEVGFNHITFNLYPNMRHEVLNEVERIKVYDDIIAFISTNE